MLMGDSRSLNKISRKFHRRFKGISEKFFSSFKEDLNMPQGICKKFKKKFRDLSKVFHGSFKGFSRRF